MKRSRDQDIDDDKNSKLKPTDIAESSGQPQMTGEGSAQKLTLVDVLEYIKHVKEKLGGTTDKYEAFTEVMLDLKSQRVDIQEVVSKVKELFADHPELLSGFNNFLPEESKIILPQEEGPGAYVKKPIEFEVAMKFVQKLKVRLEDNNLYRGFLAILNLYRIGNIAVSEVHKKVSDLLHDCQDLLTEFTMFLPPHLVNSLTVHNTPKETVTSHADPNREKVPTGAEEERTTRGENVKERSNGSGQRQHYRPTHKSNLCNLEDIVAKLFPEDMHDQMLCLREKVKQRLCNSVHYREFLKCIKHYNTENLTRSELQLLLNDLLGAQPDLMDEVNKLIDRFEKTGPYVTDQHVPESQKFDDANRDQGHNKDESNKNGALTDKRKKKRPSKRSLLSSKRKNKKKQSQELDLSNSENCTPSYWLVPKNYRIPKSGHRTETDNEVLNDQWVSLPSGSEDHPFKHSLKNEYEESLFRCEDDRFEMDMLLESMKDTIKLAEGLLELINNKSIETDGVFRIKDYIPRRNLRCVEYIYGKHGHLAVKELKKDVSLSLPIILNRLKQRLEGGRMLRSDFNKLWAQVHVENHKKSLDHRSFLLKHEDSKCLSSKGLLAEIDKINEQKSKEENLQHYISHMEFNYSDSNIHEDFYQLIKISCAEICSSQRLNKVMNIWTSFVEPMVHVPATSHTKASQVFYGDEAFYVFFRLHQAIYSRFEEAKRFANDTTPNDSYARFLDLLYNYLSGAYNDKYEEECQTIFGTWSGFIFSIERLINKLSRKLVAISRNEIDSKLLHLYAYEKMREPRRFVDEVYTANARMILNGSKIFRYECLLVPEQDGQTRFTIQKMDIGSNRLEAPVGLIDQNFAAYLSSQFLSVSKKTTGLFMKRNMKQYASGDEYVEMAKATKGVRIANNLQYKMNSTTSKLNYVLHSQDSLIRMSRPKRKSSNEFCELSNGDLLKVQNFHKLALSKITGIKHYKQND